jgi:diacylglycerol kinase family enzyme
MTQPRRKIRSVAIVLNARAQGLVNERDGSTCQHIEATLGQRGVEASVCQVEGDDIERALREAVDSSVDAVIVGGGDGTVNAAAQQLLDCDKPLGVLPLGTFNLLGRDLDMSSDPVEAIESLLDAQPLNIDYGTLNGMLFLHNSNIGVLPELIRSREEARGRNPVSATWQVLKAGWRAMRRGSGLAVRIELPDSTIQRRARSLVVSVGRYLDESALTPQREKLDSGIICVHLAPQKRLWRLVPTLLRLLAGRWKRRSDIEMIEAPELTIHLDRERARLANDGELVQTQSPLRYAVHPGRLKVLVPPHCRHYPGQGPQNDQAA